MKRREKFLMVIVGVIGIINLLLILKEIFLAWNCFLMADYWLIYNKFIGIACLYVDEMYSIKKELWRLIYSLAFSVGSIALTTDLEKYINIKSCFSSYIYIRVNTYVGLINLVASVSFLVFLVYFLKLYSYDFLIRLNIF